MSDAFPANLTKSYCHGWLCKGKKCAKNFGDCKHVHANLKTIPDADRKAIFDYIAKSNGKVWIDKKEVLQAKLQLDVEHKKIVGDENGTTGM